MKKIGIVLTSLGEGGAQRSGAILSQLLVLTGFEVSIIITQDEVDYDYSGELHSVKKSAYSNIKLFQIIKTFTVFKRLINSGHFDCVIDGRHRATWIKQRFITSFVYTNLPVIYIVHSYNLVDYLPKSSWKVKNIYKDVAVVGVSQKICNRIRREYGLTNITKIPNTFFRKRLKLLAVELQKVPDFPFILYYGRLQENEKNISFLLQAYKYSKLPKENIKLLILGSGRDEQYYRTLVKELGIEKEVVFIEFKSNPFPFVKKALFTTLTSNYEGFPMVLVESLMLGTPVVSVDCPSGPSEIVKTGINGILVSQNDQVAFIAALDKMVCNTEFYTHCKNNAMKSVAHLSPEIVGQQWKKLIEEVTK